MVVKPRLYPNHYARLGVHRGMTSEWIRQHTRALLMVTHPDRPGGQAKKFALLTLSRSVLSDEKSRQQYHNELALLAPWCPVCDAVGYKTQQAGWTKRKITACADCGGCGFWIIDKDWKEVE